jgi:class 3 adenylate cyclase/predicted ATPase
MDFYAILDQVIALLRQRQRVTYRALKVQFQLHDEALEALKEELIEAQHLAADEAGRILVWIGDAGTPSAPGPPLPQPATQQDTHAERPPAASHPPEAERRQLTVLFCDLVDSTALAGQLDPEELREVVRAYQETCAQVIARDEGHIAQYLGDGLLVYFGYPLAHEDDAQRAVRAGLGMVEALGQLNTRLGRERGVHLAMRLGIHTGLVVVGDMGGGPRREQLALGETPIIAARIQGLAMPDTVLISAATARLVQGFFTCQPLGAQDLKGLSEPLIVYRVSSESGMQTRLGVAATRGLTPLVGRDADVSLLLERWAQVKEGMGHVVVLSGEAGIGKSRLVQVVTEHIAGQPHVQWECRCSPYYQYSALAPLIDLLQRALQFERNDTPEAKLSKLEGALGQYGLALPEMVPLLAALLSLPPPDHYPPLALTPPRQRQKTLEALLTVFLALAAQQPVLLIVEDLHWSDPSTLELLTLLIDQVPTARIFALLACRLEFRPPWPLRAHLISLTLSRLPRRHVEAIVAQVTGDKTLPSEVIQQIVTKTDGVPLFVEELTKMVLESAWFEQWECQSGGAGPVAPPGALLPLAIPATLHDSLMARLDRLALAKEVAQLGATLGRTFAYELLQAVSLWDEGTLREALRRLVEAELLYQRGVLPQATYLFKHVLIQETAYQSLLKSRRQQYHERIAHVLEGRFPETTETQPELLAHHYTEAGLSTQAIAYWQRAGQCAIERSAHLEAIAHLTKGLELLTTLPDGPQRIQQELTLHIALGPALTATKGQAAPEVEHVYARARELCRQVGETPQLFQALFGLWGFYEAQGELQTALELGEQLLTLAQRAPDPALLLEAHHALGATLFWRGEVPPAGAHFAQGIALYDPQHHRSLAWLYGEDPGVVCRSYAARALWFLGHPDQALTRSHDALTLAQEVAHPFSHTYALTSAAALHQFRRERHTTQAQAEVATRLATEQGLPYWGAWGTILWGWALAVQGQGAEGIVQILQGLAAYRATGAELLCPYFLALLAEAYGSIGQGEEGLSVLEEALPIVDRNGVRFYEAELHRLRGELLLQHAVAQPGEAEAGFQQALTVARHQQAKSLELRAAMSLAHLWQHQGKRAEAYALLAPVYGWFTEGFDTADLQEAKALLEALV